MSVQMETISRNLQRFYRDGADIAQASKECLITAHGILLWPRKVKINGCAKLLFKQERGETLYGSHVKDFCEGKASAGKFADHHKSGDMVDDYTLTRYEPDDRTSIERWLAIPKTPADVIAITPGYTKSAMISGIYLSTVLSEIAYLNYEYVYCSFCRTELLDKIGTAYAEMRRMGPITIM
jgi:hypothetical protein